MAELQHKIVSSESEELILVDGNDEPIGTLSKAQCHDGDGVLHRAFSVFLFNDAGELLLQQRGSEKRLWPGYWSNSCCSHPRAGESLDYATGRRLEEELGVNAELEFIYRFSYQASFGEAGSEHEMCSVYLGRCTSDIAPNNTEVDAIRFVSAAELDAEFKDSPDSFTPWFKQEWACLQGEHAARLAKYLS